LPDERSRDAARYALLTAAVVAAAVGGYVGYVLFPRFDLPAVTGAGTLLLAAAAGFAAFFSPCSFPLLATLLARHAGDQGTARRRLGRAAAFAAALAVGATVFVLAVGGLFAFGGRSMAGAVTFTSTAGRSIRIVVGVLLVVLGAVQADKLAISFRRFEPSIHGALKRQARLRRRHPVAGTALFGFGYLAAGFG
jgi:cytochrome c biogenesis protein CcdA